MSNASSQSQTDPSWVFSIKLSTNEDADGQSLLGRLRWSKIHWQNLGIPPPGYSAEEYRALLAGTMAEKSFAEMKNYYQRHGYWGGFEQPER